MPAIVAEKPKKKQVPAKRKRTQRQYTYADYLNFPDDQRFEIINGKLRKMSPSPSYNHQRTSVNLFRELIAQLEKQLDRCELLYAPMDVVLVKPGEDYAKSKNVFQPDIFVVCDKEKITEKAIIGAPDFIIEIVSPSSLRYDRYDKFEIYRQYGVKEYWLVYPREQMIESYVLKDDKFELVDVYSLENTPAEIKTFGLKLDLTKVFK